MGMPYSATARKAELSPFFSFFFSQAPYHTTSSSWAQHPAASFQSISTAIFQLNAMVSSLSTAVTDAQARMTQSRSRSRYPLWQV